MSDFKRILLCFPLGLAAMSATADDMGDRLGGVEFNNTPATQFVRVEGPDLIKPDGSKLFIVGTNLGNWLNPEGYMFDFKKTNSPRMINELICEMVGPDKAAEFWDAFKENYITKADIDFIASTGANTIRLPFNYKLFTDEDYMGVTSNQNGFDYIDRTVEWCRDNGLYLILDMHDCPGGQTGDNIDDSYGYPWLFESERAQKQFCDIWKRIASRYANEPVILGYELMNEPIATYFDNKDELNKGLQPLYDRCTASIREVDKNHIILLGGAQWNSIFTPLDTDVKDPQTMFTCHRYGGPATADAIRSYIDFRNESNRPMYMGELGHNTDEWQAEFAETLRNNNIGYTFWPYKKINDSSVIGFNAPEGWNLVVDFSEAPRGSYSEIREHRPEAAAAQSALDGLIENIKFENCIPHGSYIRSIGLSFED